VRSEGNMSLKNPVTPPGIDPGTVRLVVQRINHYATQAPFEELVRVNLRCTSGSATQQRNCIGGLEVIMTVTVMVAVFWNVTACTDVSNDHFATTIRVELLNNPHPPSTLQRRAS